jgi:hypothetical protein
VGGNILGSIVLNTYAIVPVKHLANKIVFSPGGMDTTPILISGGLVVKEFIPYSGLVVICGVVV